MVSIQSVIYNLFKSTNVFLLGPPTQLPQIRKNLCGIRKSPLLGFSRLLLQSKEPDMDPGDQFSCHFSPWCLELKFGCSAIFTLQARGQRERKGRGKDCTTGHTSARWSSPVWDQPLPNPRDPALLLPSLCGGCCQAAPASPGTLPAQCPAYPTLAVFSKELPNLSMPAPSSPTPNPAKVMTSSPRGAALAVPPSKHPADTQAFQDKAIQLHWCKTAGITLQRSKTHTSTGSPAPDHSTHRSRHLLLARQEANK